MPIKHIVQQGECLSKIAKRYGFLDYRKVYEHPSNAELRQNRPNPNVLFPGDTIVIPDPTPKTVSVAHGRVHRFTVKAPRRYVRLNLKDGDGKPLAGKPYRLIVHSQEVATGNTDGDGFLEECLSFDFRKVELECEGRAWALDVGALNPLEKVPDEGVSGAEARLINLGYDLEPTGRMTIELRSAIRAFQHQHGLEVTGRLDPKTLQKLEKQHGS
jgi:N-acetylmuramoyl-L-alanine amidase